VASLLKIPMVDVSPDWRVYLWVFLVAGTAGLLAGLAPARFIRKGNLIASLKTDRLSAPSGVRSPRRVRALLLGLQAAASIVLLAVAALLTRGMIRATTIETGFDADRLINVRVTLPKGTDDATAEAYWKAAVGRVQGFPDVSGVALAWRAPFDGIGWQWRSLTGRPIQLNETSAQYFATTGIRLLRGRIYTDEEARAGAPVALISTRVAQEFWDHEDPIGTTLERVWGPDAPAGPGQSGLARRPHGARVIGVVSEAVTSLRRHDAPQIYLPIAPSNLSHAQMVVAARADPARLIGALGDAVRAVNPDALASLSLVRNLLANERQPSLSLAQFALLLSGTALSLACIGLFGVTAFAVAERRHELSIRMALGATVRQVVTLVMRESLMPVVAGLAVGAIAALFAGQILSSLLYGIGSRDPIALISAVVLLFGAALAAAFIPARRVARVDPLQDLKTP
jgi:predicted permease